MSPRTESPAAVVPVETKAFMFRGYVTALERAGLLDEVRARVSERTRALIERPPLVTTWLPHEPTDELLVALDKLRGMPAVRRISREATLGGLAPTVRSIVESVLRVLGVSPASLLSRMPQLTSSAARGVVWEWAPRSANSGTMTVRYPARKNMPECVFESVGGGLEAIFELCRAEGKVSTAELLPGGNAARFLIKWSTD